MGIFKIVMGWVGSKQFGLCWVGLEKWTQVQLCDVLPADGSRLKGEGKLTTCIMTVFHYKFEVLV